MQKIGLSLNIANCEYLSFNDKFGTGGLNCRLFIIPRVSSLRWLGISICDSVSALRRKTVSDIKDNLKMGYAKIVANRGRYNRRGLAKFYSTFCDHAILFVSGVYPLF